MKAEDIAPVVTWGTSPEDVLPITDFVPSPDNFQGSKIEAAAVKVRQELELEFIF